MTGRSPDYVTDSLRLAREIHADAETLLAKNSYRSAADRAYYSMFHAAHAALYHEGGEIPRSHSGLVRIFSRDLVRSGKLPKDLGRWLAQGHRLRQKSDYEVYAELDPEIVARLVERSDEFIRTIEGYVFHCPAG